MNLPGNFERFFGNLPWRPFNCKSASREAVRYAKHLKCPPLPDYVPDFSITEQSRKFRRMKLYKLFTIFKVLN